MAALVDRRETELWPTTFPGRATCVIDRRTNGAAHGAAGRPARVMAEAGSLRNAR